MSFDSYFDHAGLLVNKFSGDDCGDSAQMMGLYRFGRYMKLRKDKESLAREQAKFAQELDILTYVEDVKDKEQTIIRTIPHPGTYVRHPSPCTPNWAGNPHTFSRDQQRSLVFAMGALKQKRKLLQAFWKHILRLGWYQNDQETDGTSIPLYRRDVAPPDVLGEYLRAGYMAGFYFLAVLWPLLFASDIFLIIGLLGNLYKWKEDPTNVDDDNQLLELLQAKVALPTPLSFLARKIYKYFRPGGVLKAFTTKHRLESGSPPFTELYTDIINKEL